jgi:molecular chaperone DnaK
LSIETLGGISTFMIPRNTTIPTRKTETFSTAADNQSEVTVVVLQGERQFAKDNRKLGQFNLTGIPPAPRGVPQIEVTFDIDANGILNVTAKDKATNKDQKITITSSSGLSKEEVDRMAKEAESHASEDKERREAIEARNQLDSMVYNVEKMLRENGDKISGDDKSAVESALADAKKALEGEDTAIINSARERLQSASHKLAEAMYKSAGPAAGATGEGASSQTASGNGSSEKKAEDVIDAEYVDVDEKK